jgi:hypothetical protein
MVKGDMILERVDMIWGFHSMVSWNWYGTTLEWGTFKVC